MVAQSVFTKNVDFRIAQSAGRSSRVLLTRALAVIILLLHVATAVMAQPGPRKIVVADDMAYPPFVFLTADGTPRGIVVDVWNLWSRKTGITVEIRLMEWGEALDAVRTGRADAVGGMFRTSEREKDFDFVYPLRIITTAIFYDKRISGLKGLEDLAGFNVACVSGDSGEELLRAASSRPNIVPYPDLATLVKDAVAGKVKVFVADVPSARFYLAQHDGGDLFNQSPNIDRNRHYVGVQKGNDSLRRTIREGFSRVSAEEIDAIYEEWYGAPALMENYLRPVAWSFGLLLLLLLIGYSWNWSLRRRVRAAVADLERQHNDLLKIQRETKRSEEKFRLIFENAPYAISINKLKDGTIVDANAAYLSSFSLSGKEEAVGRTFSEYGQLTQDNSRKIVQTLLEKKRVENVEAHVVMKDGTTKNIIYSSALMETETEPAVLSIVVDVTERVKAEEALRRSEDKFRLIFGHVPIGIYRTTLSGEIVDANPALIRILGYEEADAAQAVGRNLVGLIYSSEKEREPILRTVLESPEGVRMEMEVPRKDGSTFSAVVNASVEFDQRGNPAFINGTVEDVTKARKSEEELRRLAAAVEQSSAITVITTVDGRIEYVNKAFEQCTGYSRQDALGRNPNLLKSGEHDRRFYREMWETILAGKVWHGRFHNKKKDGSRYIEDASIFPILDARGAIINFVAVKQDVTREVFLESQNHQMQKMESIGQLTGGVAHDFNNLLQVIKGYTELGLDAVEKSHVGHDYLQEIGKAGERAGKLVQQLLLFSRQKIMQPMPLDLNQAVGDLLKMLGRLIGEHIQIKWLPNRSPVVIFADAGMIDQVVMNLCVNARDAMPAGGALTIETSKILLDEEFSATHAWAGRGAYALLQVSDNGTGMDPRTQERIFEPFFTTKGEGKGTGMGLATVYGIVRQHQGMIDVYSELGFGSQFRVYLPLHQTEQADTAREEAMVEPDGGNETILLAEDDENVRQFASTVLGAAGYRVLQAQDGLDAVRVFKENRESVDMVALDVVMPGLNGKDAFELIKAFRPAVPALFTSGYSKNAIHTDFVLSPGVHLLQKPYSRRDLLRMIRLVLNGKSS
jgi:PAS domain S-box-containing protein